MRSIFNVITVFSFGLSSIWANLDCPAETAVHVDTRTMLPDGSVNPTYDQEIETGLCGCLGFAEGVNIDGNQVTFSVVIVDNEPIRGIELNIYHNTDLLTYVGVSKGTKLENVTDSNGAPRNMTLIDNYLDGYLKVLAYSTSQAQTTGNGVEGTLLTITYELAEGEVLPEQVEFYFGLANLPGTSAQPELLNVVCAYPTAENPAVVPTEALALDAGAVVPQEFALNQNYPNPFNPSTQISFDVPAGAEFVNLTVYNILGQKINTLINGATNPGRYTLDWNATDEIGNPVASGIYFYELRSESFVSRKKMLLMR